MGNDYDFHKDSIWTIEISNDFNFIYTGGKDGCIYQVDIMNDKVSLLY